MVGAQIRGREYMVLVEDPCGMVHVQIVHHTKRSLQYSSTGQW